MLNDDIQHSEVQEDCYMHGFLRLKINQSKIPLIKQNRSNLSKHRSNYFTLLKKSNRDVIKHLQLNAYISRQARNGQLLFFLHLPSHPQRPGLQRLLLLPHMQVPLHHPQLAPQPPSHAQHHRPAPLSLPPLRPLVQDPQGPLQARLPPRLLQAQDLRRVRHDLQDLVPPQAPLAHPPQQSQALQLPPLPHELRAQGQIEAARGQARQPPAVPVRPVREGLLQEGASEGPRDQQALQGVSVHVRALPQGFRACQGSA